MKHNFDNRGFAQVQANVINLPRAELLPVVLKIKTDFVGWMSDNFLLDTSQEEQLIGLDASFRQSIADAVADSWENRDVIFFNKEEKEEEDDKSIKDIILEDLEIISQSSGSTTTETNTRIAIRILYR